MRSSLRLQICLCLKLILVDVICHLLSCASDCKRPDRSGEVCSFSLVVLVVRFLRFGAHSLYVGAQYCEISRNFPRYLMRVLREGEEQTEIQGCSPFFG